MVLRTAPISLMVDLPSSLLKRVALLWGVFSFVAVGITHFTNSAFFVSIVPPYLPAHLELVWLSGAFEILGGLGLLFARTRRLASFGLIALMIAVFPANIHMAMNPAEFVAQGMPEWGLYLRLPFQFLFIAWVYWIGKPLEAAPVTQHAPPTDEGPI